MSEILEQASNTVDKLDQSAPREAGHFRDLDWRIVLRLLISHAWTLELRIEELEKKLEAKSS